MLFHVIALVIYVVMFGYFFANGLLHEYFYWPYLVCFCLPAIRIFLIGHWGQHLERTVSSKINDFKSLNRSYWRSMQYYDTFKGKIG